MGFSSLACWRSQKDFPRGGQISEFGKTLTTTILPTCYKKRIKDGSIFHTTPALFNTKLPPKNTK